jgi:hypothetical protein
MVAFAMIMDNKLRERPTKVSLTEQDVRAPDILP